MSGPLQEEPRRYGGQQNGEVPSPFSLFALYFFAAVGGVVALVLGASFLFSMSLHAGANSLIVALAGCFSFAIWRARAERVRRASAGVVPSMVTFLTVVLIGIGAVSLAQRRNFAHSSSRTAFSTAFSDDSELLSAFLSTHDFLIHNGFQPAHEPDYGPLGGRYGMVSDDMRIIYYRESERTSSVLDIRVAIHPKLRHLDISYEPRSTSEAGYQEEAARGKQLAEQMRHALNFLNNRDANRRN